MVNKVTKVVAPVDDEIEDDVQTPEQDVSNLSSSDILSKMMTTAASNKAVSRWLEEDDGDDDGGTSHIEGDLLKFTKGDYFAGKNNDDIPIGTRLIVDMDSLQIWVGALPRTGDRRSADRPLHRPFRLTEAPRTRLSRRERVGQGR
jgi:hypothetical protein